MMNAGQCMWKEAELWTYNEPTVDFMKRILLGICVMAGMTCMAQNNESALKFNQDGIFRIVQFTDMHLDAGSAYRIAQAEKTFARLSRVMNEGKPDMVVFTGDVVTGKPAAEMWNRLLDSMAVYKVPFCVVLGNHDAEQDLTRRQMAELVMSSPYSLNGKNASGELADMSFEVTGSRTCRPEAVLYFMDSHDYSTIDGLDGYGWFTPGQVEWLRESCSAKTDANGGRPLPSLAFFHIALQEYVSAWDNEENSHIGRAAEDECPGVLNTGMYAAMVETGSVMGTFVGHDHDIDYVVAQHGIALGYGRFSGDDTTYNNLRPGARIIVLKEGERGFESWITEDDGRVVDHMVFDGEKITEL